MKERRTAGWAAVFLAGTAAISCMGGARSGNYEARVVTGPPDMAGVAAFAPGDRALCRRAAGDVTFPGRVADIEQGRLVMLYDDGKKESITPRYCEKLGTPSVVAVTASGVGAFAQGARVRCRWKGGDREYSGQVTEVRGNRLFIQYDDGDQELIEAGLCRGDAGSGLAASSFQPGARVRCHWKGGAKEYRGKVAEVRGDRIFIQYDDGDQELIAPQLCQPDAGSGLAVSAFKPGDRVRCFWKGGPTEYPGKIASIQDGNLSIHYDDGDQETTTPSLCRHDQGGPTPVIVTGTGGGLSGGYSILSASNPGGGRAYTGQVGISKGAEAYTLQWSIPGTPPYGGVGIEVDSVLGVGWGTQGEDYGVVVYRVQGGSLRGTWASSSTGGRVGAEDLQGPAGLNGDYRIVRSQSPGGGTYTGTVRIAPSGDTFTLQWTLPRESYGGVGILRGNLLVVGWGAGRGAGVVAYTKAGKRLDGVWATPGGTQLGSELLERK